MSVRWVTATSLVVVVVAGAAATLSPRLSIAATSVCVLAAIAAMRFRPVDSVPLKSLVQTDWILVLLPTVVAIRLFSAKAALLIIGLMVVRAFLRKSDGRYSIEPGPLLLLFAASAIVFSRPDHVAQPLTFLLVGTLVVRLVLTVDARKIIGSLVDGCGLYLLVNVLWNTAGLPSPISEFRIGGLAESTGFVRTLFPLTSSLNTPPTIASIYVVAMIFMLLEAGWLRRALRLFCFIAAIVVLISVGSRVAMLATALISITVICFPPSTRWLAQAATIVTAISAFVLPAVLASIQSAVAPLLALTPGRVSGSESITSLEGRDVVWATSITHWLERVNDLPHVLLGFGLGGHHRSGASLAYSNRFMEVLSHPETATMHNSFLQQLFDAGVVGYALLMAAAFWASTRLSKRRKDWGHRGMSAVVAMTALLLSGMTEVSLAPGATHETFWLLLVLVGVACQASGRQADSPWSVGPGSANRGTASGGLASMSDGASGSGIHGVQLQRDVRPADRRVPR
jgi:hypothetical protein